MKKALSLLLVLILILSCVPFVALAEAAEDEEIQLEMGTVEENKYWNPSIQLGCTLGEQWNFLSEEEILEINGFVQGQLEEDFVDWMNSSDYYQDMYAVNVLTSATVNIAVEKLNLVNAITMSEKLYCELSCKSLVDALTQMGIENVKTDMGEIALDGETHSCIRVSGTIQNLKMFESLVTIKMGNRMIVLGVCCYGEDTCDEVLSSFYRTEK